MKKLLLTILLIFTIIFTKAQSPIVIGDTTLAGTSPIMCLNGLYNGKIYASSYYSNNEVTGYNLWNDTSWATILTLTGNNAITASCSDIHGNFYQAFYNETTGYAYVAMQIGASGNMVELKGSNTLMSLSSNIAQYSGIHVYTICSDAYGNIYAAGLQSNPNSTPTKYYNIDVNYFVAKWDGKSWSYYAQGLPNNWNFWQMGVDIDGNIYATSQTPQYFYTYFWDKSTGQWGALSKNYTRQIQMYFNTATNNLYFSPGDTVFRYNSKDSTYTTILNVHDITFFNFNVDQYENVYCLSDGSESGYGQGSFPILEYVINNTVPIVTLPTTAITTTVSDKQISVYPNPTNDYMNVNMQGTVNVYNQLGLLVLTSTSTSVDFSSLESGLYTVVLTSQSSQYTAKIIKQ